MESIQDAALRLESTVDLLEEHVSQELQRFKTTLQSLKQERAALQQLMQDFITQNTAKSCGQKRKREDATEQRTATIKLNVGGQHLDVAADAVDESTLLGCLLHERWRSLLLTDDQGRIFLDFDIDWLAPVFDAMWLAHMQGSQLSVLEECEVKAKQSGYQFTLQYFQLLRPQSKAVMRELTTNTPLLIVRPQSNAAGFQSKLVDQLNPALTASIRELEENLLAEQEAMLTELCFIVQYVAHSRNLPGLDLEIFAGRKEHTFCSCNRHATPISVGSEWWVEPSVTKDMVNQLSMQGRIQAGLAMLTAMLDQQPTSSTGIGADEQLVTKHDIATSKELHNMQRMINACCVRSDGAALTFSVLWSALKHTNNNWRAMLVQHNTVEIFVKTPSVTRANYELFTRGVDYFSKQELLDALQEAPALACDDATASSSVVSQIQQPIMPMVAQASTNNGSAQAPFLVSFNVSGKKHTINRQHLLAALPDSQLAARLSGRWTEQARDLDDEGRICYDLPRGPFDCLMNYVRIHALQGRDAELIISPEQHPALLRMLDYLLIEPELTWFM